MPTRLETVHEKAYVKWLDNYVFWSAIKIYKRGWPDRLIIGPGPVMFWIEFKRDATTELRKLQTHVKWFLEMLGFKVYVCRSAEAAKKITVKHFQS